MTERNRRRPSNGTGFSHELLSGLTRGLSVPVSRETRPARKGTYTPGDTFEQTYPRYPFSELVRLAITLAEWYRRRRATIGLQSENKRSGSHAGPGPAGSKLLSPGKGR